ncbi:hypothetical protein [Pararhizobium gei]|uniref:hypothetical protein n=1 Tax=Pararhizobium gei TaxID=1395951 RepID=UPI003D9C7BC2
MRFPTVICRTGKHANPIASRLAAELARRWRPLLFALAGTALSAASAHAHDAPSGWSYPFSCCSNQDCRPVATKAISERPQGYVVNVTGEVVPYSDTRVRTSPDGEFHWCSLAGEEKSRTLCLFVPPRSF